MIVLIRCNLFSVEREEFDQQELKRVARLINSYVATHSVSGEDCPYRVDVSTMKGMKGVRTDIEALSVSVYTTMMDQDKRIFLGIICGVETAPLNLRSDDCANLPLFLTAGNVDTTERVIYGLEKYFDCQITSMALPQEELKWMSTMWVGLELRALEMEERTDQSSVKKRPGTKSKKQELRLSYGLPANLTKEGEKQKLRHITCAFPISDINKVSVVTLDLLLLLLDANLDLDRGSSSRGVRVL